MAKPKPFDWLFACAEHLYTEKDLETGTMAETFLADCRILLDGALALAENAVQICNRPGCREGYAINVKDDAQKLNQLYGASSIGLSAFMDTVASFSFTRLATYKLNEPSEIAIRDQIKDMRTRYKKLITAIRDNLPSNAAKALDDLNAMQPSLKGLAQMAVRTHEIFQELKRERNVIDFSDLEHMALDILSRPELRKKIANQFDAVFVDEYQDISAIQEAILNGLRRDMPEGDNDLPRKRNLRFYVGDVKQSIYRFRQADPSLFMDKQRNFHSDEYADQRKIILNQNFRSRVSVLHAVNRVFTHVMRPQVTEIDYDDDAKLYPPPDTPFQWDEPMKLHVLDSAAYKAADRPAAEAGVIAAEIRHLVDTPMLDRKGDSPKAWQYSDMVILMPAAKGIVGIVEKTLADAGIPVYCEDGQRGMESVEIRQALNHLRLLNNRMDDLSLLAVLRGPLYAMNEDELSRIRLHKPEREASFLDALAAIANDETDALASRCRSVLDDLAHERFMLCSMPLDEYLWDFLSRSGMYVFYGAQPGGKLRQANLRMLCNRASEHMRTRGGELADFLASVAELEGIRDGGSPTVMSPWENVVRIMTIHKSKGLEFPLVFVMGLGGTLTRRNPIGYLSMHPELGVSLQYVNPIARTKRHTLLGSAIAMRQRAEDRAERARVLYVALTRAKDRLIAVGTGGGKFGARNSEFGVHSGGVYSVWEAGNEEFGCRNSEFGIRSGGTYSVWEAGSMLEWLCQCIRNTDEVIQCGVRNAEYGMKDDAECGTLIVAPEENSGECGMQNTDQVIQEVDNDTTPANVQIPNSFSSPSLWETELQTQFPTFSTNFPYKTSDWRVVFHIEADKSTSLAEEENEDTANALSERPHQERWVEALLKRMAHDRFDISSPYEGHRHPALSDPDPIAPNLRLNHAPFKLGVTAYVRSQRRTGMIDVTAALATASMTGTTDMADAAGTPHATNTIKSINTADTSGSPATPGTFAFPHQDTLANLATGGTDDEVEKPEDKRLPFPLIRPRLLADTPALPAYLRANEEQSGLLRGIATHKALSMIPYEALKDDQSEPTIRKELARLQAADRMTADEYARVDASMLHRFFASSIGQRALGANKLHREWQFNLRAPDLSDSLLQGVIDLCFWEDDGWVLVDYKTDCVGKASDLWASYGLQVRLYERALPAATGSPVSEAILFALALGEGSSRRTSL